jgi:hypothetical protein
MLLFLLKVYKVAKKYLKFLIKGLKQEKIRKNQLKITFEKLISMFYYDFEFGDTFFKK